MERPAAAAKTQAPISVLYAKSCSHLFMRYHAIGEAMIKAIITSLMKSLESSVTIF